MQQFHFTVAGAQGLHVRPAGELARLAAGCAPAVITIARGDETVQATQLLRLLSLAVKPGDKLTVTVEGGDEEETAAAVERLLREQL
ncbi:MAG: HPr family phosphocarrier protein [Clostridiales bacterium]|nr:HPr family phosphocarrier protein [Clostridiales bacterium]